MFSSQLSWLLVLLAMVLLAIVAIGIVRNRPFSKSLKIYPPGYVQGVQDLFSDQPDKAVAVFMRMLELDPETVEPHFALATLFRRRGEVERAIRIHQNLILRQGLDPDSKVLALEGLAKDYLHAGLLDRAESVANNILETDPKNQAGMQVLLSVFEQENEWAKALSVARSLVKTGQITKSVFSQYYCELAEVQRQNGEIGAARKSIKSALGQDEKCSRAGMILGDIEMGAGHIKAAIKSYQRVAWTAPEYLADVVAPLLDCYARQGGVESGFNILKKVVLEQSSIRPVLLIAEHIEAHVGADEAARYVRHFLRQRPSLRGMLYLMDKQFETMGHVDEDWSVLHDGIRTLSLSSKSYRCERCGFSGQTLHWKCPGCRGWGQMQSV